MKRPPVVLTGPIPTVEEVAAISGMSRKRMLELVALADSLIAEREKKHTRKRAAKSSAMKKGAAKRVVKRVSR